MDFPIKEWSEWFERRLRMLTNKLNSVNLFFINGLWCFFWFTSFRSNTSGYCLTMDTMGRRRIVFNSHMLELSFYLCSCNVIRKCTFISKWGDWEKFRVLIKIIFISCRTLSFHRHKHTCLGMCCLLASCSHCILLLNDLSNLGARIFS